MIVEYIRYALPDGRGEVLERADAQAQGVLRDSAHGLGWELSRCVEDPNRHLLRIEWDSAEGRLFGFRASPGFRAFFAAIRPFVGDIEEMRHYVLTPVRGAAGWTEPDCAVRDPGRPFALE